MNNSQLTPPVNKDLAPISSSDCLWILKSLPWQLRESFACNHSPALLLSKTVLLAVGSIPNPVHKDVRNIQKGQEIAIPVIFSRVILGKIDCAMAIAQWHTGEVPEYEHESPFLVVHVPIQR